MKRAKVNINKIISNYSISAISNDTLIKINEKNFFIPKTNDFKVLLKYNYNVAQLKKICKHYKIKSTGKKNDLINSIYNFLRIHKCINCIQRNYRAFTLKKYNYLHGPARFNRKICVNETDFYSMDDIASLSYEQFYSFKDNDDKIYGFDIKSLYQLFSKGRKMENPYNRKEFPSYVKKNIKHLIKLSNIYSNFTNGKSFLILHDTNEILTPKQLLETRTLDVFQKMDALGHYTCIQWFSQLDRLRVANLICFLADIWDYRAQLPISTKKEICPPYGNPFGSINMLGLRNNTIDMLKSKALTIMEKLVNTGVNNESKYLGSTYVLCSLTLVSKEAASSMPWLYESVV